MENPTRTITLFCWTLGVSNSSFPVDIEDSRTVGHLKDAIVNKSVKFIGVGADQIALWKVSIAIDRGLKNEVTKHQFRAQDVLLETDPLSDIFPQPGPAQMTLHIVAQLPPALLWSPHLLSLVSRVKANQRVLKRALDNSAPTGPGPTKRIKTLALTKGELKAITKLHEDLQKVLDDPGVYSNTSRISKLPFPSIDKIPSGFLPADSDNGSIAYIGREAFSTVWKAWLKVKCNARYLQSIYIYGSEGYGKSYILAALTCLLIRLGERVVYLPDCRNALYQPMMYLKTAMLVAFSDSNASNYRERIQQCDSEDDLVAFCGEYRADGQLCFIADQINALDLDPSREDYMTNEAKASLRILLGKMWYFHINIRSASANHKSATYARKDTDEQKIALLGGMTSEEMAQWWQHNEGPSVLDLPDKQRIGDLTGCIPGLLAPFVSNAGKDLNQLEPAIWNNDLLASVRSDVLAFAARQLREEKSRRDYTRLIHACLMHSPASGIEDLLDHRYFYVDADSCCRYTCGLARQAIIEFLREDAEEHVFLAPGWYRYILDSKDNGSVIGFTVEKMDISRLASSCLRSDNLVLRRAAITSFASKAANIFRSKGSHYYVPVQFNFKTIDALYVQISERKGASTAKVTGIQIAIGSDCKKTQEMFFNQWDDLIQPLIGFKVEASFLWIVEGKRGREEMEEKVTELRNRNLHNWPNYTVHWASVEQIDRRLAETLADIHPNHWKGDPSGCGIGHGDGHEQMTNCDDSEIRGEGGESSGCYQIIPCQQLTKQVAPVKPSKLAKKR